MRFFNQRLGFWIVLIGALPMPFAALVKAQGLSVDAPRTNAFNDPFVQVTSSLPQCPVPEGRLYTAAEVRSQHGGSCYRVGRCRLPTSYLYDAEIIPHEQRCVREEGRFDETSVWILGERRLVTLQGCVQSQAPSNALEKAVWLVDDVMGVINLLQVGTERSAARYPLAGVPAASAR